MKELILMTLVALTFKATAQCSVTNTSGTNDYTITAYFSPTGTVTCSGSNTVFEVSYSISVDGSSIPSQPAFYYQAGLTCGSTNFSGPNLPLVTNSNTSVNGTYSTGGNYIAGSSCATTGTPGSDTPASLGCTGASNITWVGNGPGINFSEDCPSVDVALPIKVKEFTGRFKEGAIELLWQTADATFFDYFALEKSYNAQSFEKIGDKIKLNTIGNYSFEDNDINIKHQYTYYRLKLVDLDGSIKFSKIIAIENFDPQLKWQIAPNPIGTSFSVKWDTSLFNVKTIRITNNIGKQVYISSANEKGYFTASINLNGPHVVQLLDSYGRSLTKRVIFNQD